MLPWGVDQTWGVFLGFDSGGLLFKACRADSRCDAGFRRALLEVGPAIARLDLAGETDRLGRLLAPYQADDPRRPHDATQTTTELNGVRRFIATRRSGVDAWAAAGLPPALAAGAGGAATSTASSTPPASASRPPPPGRPRHV